MKNLNKISLVRIKAKALELNKSKQLPFALCKEIYELQIDYEPRYIALVMALTEEYIRVRNYYRKYPEKEKEANEHIKKILTKGV